MAGDASIVELACRVAGCGEAPPAVLPDQIRVEAQLRETLLAYHPGVTALFSSIDRDATLAFLRDYPNPEAASRVGEARMAGFCRRIGYTGRVPASERVERLRTNLLSGSHGSIAGHQFAALAQAEHLELLNNQLREFNRRVDHLLDRHPDSALLESFPGIGRITAADLAIRHRNTWWLRPVPHPSHWRRAKSNESGSATPATGGCAPQQQPGPTHSNASTRSPGNATSLHLIEERPGTGRCVPSQPAGVTSTDVVYGAPL